MSKLIGGNPSLDLKLPYETAGRRVERSRLTTDEVARIIANFEEPCATLALLLYVSGFIGEALGMMWPDLNGDTVTISRRMYAGKIGKVKTKKSERRIWLDSRVIDRLRKLNGTEFVFQSKNGTPLNQMNLLIRKVRPTVESLGMKIGGWHDFRHTLNKKLQQAGERPRAVSDILGHVKVDLAATIYDGSDERERVEALAAVSNELLPRCDPDVPTSPRLNAPTKET